MGSACANIHDGQRVRENNPHQQVGYTGAISPQTRSENLANREGTIYAIHGDSSIRAGAPVGMNADPVRLRAHQISDVQVVTGA